MLPIKTNIEFGGGLTLDSVHNTATLTTKSQNNFLVTDLQNFNLIVFTSTGDVDLKGLDSSGVNGWQKFVIMNGNTTATNLKIKKNNSGSLAANRFLIKDDIIINFGEFYFIIYNQNQQRWNVHAKE